MRMVVKCNGVGFHADQTSQAGYRLLTLRSLVRLAESQPSLSTFVLGLFALFLSLAFLYPQPVLASPSSVYATVWDGVIDDATAGRGTIHFAFSPKGFGNGINGTFGARFAQGKYSNSGEIEQLIESASQIRFRLVSSIDGSCAYDVTATIRGDHLLGSYVGSDECSSNHGTFDALFAT